MSRRPPLRPVTPEQARSFASSLHGHVAQARRQAIPHIGLPRNTVAQIARDYDRLARITEILIEGAPNITDSETLQEITEWLYGYDT